MMVGGRPYLFVTYEISDENDSPASARQGALWQDGGQVWTNSRDVAAYFGKRHDNVLATLTGSVGLLRFQETGSARSIRRTSRTGSRIARST
jgi:hypothetical protein